MRQFVTSLGNESNIIPYVKLKFPRKTEAKIKAGIFEGPQIRDLMKDSNFTTVMNETEKSAWLSFKCVTENFLGNKKAENYEELVDTMLANFKTLGSKIS